MATNGGVPAVDDVGAFLRSHYGEGRVADVEPLGGGDWSRAFSFRLDGADLVARFGKWREDFEADERAMVWNGPDLPVPRVLEIGDAFDGAYVISERHFGPFLEQLDPEATRAVLPALLRTFDALRAIPQTARAAGDVTWAGWLPASMEDVPGGRVSGWRAKIAASPSLDALYVDGERAMHALLPVVPELRHVLHNDLINRNVLVAGDYSRLEAVFDWGCTVPGDFLYEMAWFTFWGPWHAGLAALDLRRVFREHFTSTGVAVPDFDERIACYELHIALTHLAYFAFARPPDDPEHAHMVAQLEGLLAR